MGFVCLPLDQPKMLVCGAGPRQALQETGQETGVLESLGAARRDLEGP